MPLSVKSPSASIKVIQLICWTCPGQRWYLTAFSLSFYPCSSHILVSTGFISPLTFSIFVSIQNFFLLSSSMDKTVRLWHISRRECLCCFQHIDFVTAIAFHPRVSLESPCITSLSTNHTSINFGSQTVLIVTLYSCFAGWQVLFKWLSGWKATALEHSRQEGGAVERGGRTNTPHHCS